MYSTIATLDGQGGFSLLEPISMPKATKVQIQILPYDSPNQSTELKNQYFTRLENTLSQLTRPWKGEYLNLTYQTIVRIFRNDLITLSELLPAKHSRLCAMIILAIQYLESERLSLTQASVIRSIFDKMRQRELSKTELDKCYLNLLDADFDMTMSLGDDVVQSYLDEF